MNLPVDRLKEHIDIWVGSYGDPCGLAGEREIKGVCFLDYRSAAYDCGIVSLELYLAD